MIGTQQLEGHPLDEAVLASLRGFHAGLSEHRGRAVRYLPDVAAFAAVPRDADEQDWRDLAELTGGGDAVLADPPTRRPPQWELVDEVASVQLVGGAVQGEDDAEAVVLGSADVPEVLDLVGRTHPGPFARRGLELGTYRGIRRGGALVAMAGERFRLPGWTEVSAVCTDPSHRGQGLASRLVGAVTAGIRRRGEAPFLHTAARNTGAIRLYESLGFAVRLEAPLVVLRPPS